jgi:hypothetical protein
MVPLPTMMSHIRWPVPFFATKGNTAGKRGERRLYKSEQSRFHEFWHYS